MEDQNPQLTDELLMAEKLAIGARLELDPDTIDRVNYYSKTIGPGRVVVTTVVELKKTE